MAFQVPSNPNQCYSVLSLYLPLLKDFSLVMDWGVLKSHGMSGSLIHEMQFKGEGWRKVLIIPASQGKVKLLSGFVCGLDIGAIFLHVTNPFGSAL